MQSTKRIVSTARRFPAFRPYSDVAPTNDALRSQLLTDLKAAMKNKNTMASTTIRAVLAEVYAADKVQPGNIPDSGIISLLRKASLRRLDNASQFEKGGREDLAAKEREEHTFLASYLPSLLPKAEVDKVLMSIIDELKATAKSGESKKLTLTWSKSKPKLC